MLETLAIVPARGGSKGIPHKNIALLAGRPLLAYTCDAARESRYVTRAVLSTDEEAIAAVGRSLGIEVPFLRPPDLARDETPMLDVLLHVVRELKSGRPPYQPEIVVLLQPTSPLRTGAHVDAAVDILVTSNADVVVSVMEVPHQFGMNSQMNLEAGRLLPLVGDAAVLRRQDKPKTYARNGPAVLALRYDYLATCNSLYSGDCRAYVMDAWSSIDIDSALDLAFAGCLLENPGIIESAQDSFND